MILLNPKQPDMKFVLNKNPCCSILFRLEQFSISETPQRENQYQFNLVTFQYV